MLELDFRGGRRRALDFFITKVILKWQSLNQKMFLHVLLNNICVMKNLKDLNKQTNKQEQNPQNKWTSKKPKKNPKQKPGWTNPSITIQTHTHIPVVYIKE